MTFDSEAAEIIYALLNEVCADCEQWFGDDLSEVRDTDPEYISIILRAGRTLIGAGYEAPDEYAKVVQRLALLTAQSEAVN